MWTKLCVTHIRVWLFSPTFWQPLTRSPSLFQPKIQLPILFFTFISSGVLLLLTMWSPKECVWNARILVKEGGVILEPILTPNKIFGDIFRGLENHFQSEYTFNNQYSLLYGFSHANFSKYFAFAGKGYPLLFWENKTFSFYFSWFKLASVD